MPPEDKSVARPRMPAAQRLRSRAGCTRCRRLRKRCDQQKPDCSRCQQADIACSYELKIKWGGRAFPKLLGNYAGCVQRLDNAADGDGFVYIAQPHQSEASGTWVAGTRGRQCTSEESARAAVLPSIDPFPCPPAQQKRFLEPADSETGTDFWRTHRVDGLEEDESDDVATMEPPFPATTTTTVSCRSDPSRALALQLDRIPYVSLPRKMDAPEISSDLSPTHRFLLHHYVHETIRLTAPSDYVRTEICRSIVPMSFRHPCLLFALLAFAARHLHSLVGDFPASQGEAFITKLEDHSTSSLRQQLTDPNFNEHAAALATTRTLCQSQIFAAGSSWRTHLEGARAILQAAVAVSLSSGTGRKRAIIAEAAVVSQPSHHSPIHMFLASWYNNTEAQVALTPLGLRRGQLEMASSSSSSSSRSSGSNNSRLEGESSNGRRQSHVYFDVFGGVASDVPDLFREVGALVMERRRLMKSQQRCRHFGEEDSILCGDDIAREAQALVREIHARLRRDAVGKLRLDDNLLVSLSCDDMHDYALGNAGFLHTALLHIHCAVQGLPLSAPEVRHSVQQIIWSSDNMKSASALSPRVLMATPLFTAGLWALPDAQVAIKRSFEAMGTWMRTPHNRRSAALLEHVWSKTSIQQRHHDVLMYLKQNPEFLPY